ncbi:MAG: DNA-deoxyinosine glycosylase [Xanthomonadales bacterium]|nr:DNA-deoxyinosine glycosylase [Xanthomonadales bacterium]
MTPPLPADRGFPPIADGDATTLVLGTMPSQASLAAGQYYAHPRNAFWSIMGRLFDFDPKAPYPERVCELQRAHVAVWDVIASCRRPGSLDSDIDATSVVVNDFSGLLDECGEIRTIAFNGRTAQALFGKHVRQLTGNAKRYRCLALPSTSPAHAAMHFETKLERWSVLRKAPGTG